MELEQLLQAIHNEEEAKVKSIIDSESLDLNQFHESVSRTVLHYAMWQNSPSIVTTLLSSETIRVDLTDCFGWTGLHYACAFGIGFGPSEVFLKLCISV